MDSNINPTERVFNHEHPGTEWKSPCTCQMRRVTRGPHKNLQNHKNFKYFYVNDSTAWRPVAQHAALVSGHKICPVMKESPTHTDTGSLWPVPLRHARPFLAEGQLQVAAIEPRQCSIPHLAAAFFLALLAGSALRFLGSADFFAAAFSLFFSAASTCQTMNVWGCMALSTHGLYTRTIWTSLLRYLCCMPARLRICRDKMTRA